MQSAAAAGAVTVAPRADAAEMPPNRFEGAGTPKLCLGIGDAGAAAQGTPDEIAASGARRLRQIGVEHAITGMGRIPWDEETLRALLGRYKANGVTIGNIMIGGFDRAIYNRPGRDEDIEKVIQSVQAAGRAGLPVVEYNWYAHRAMEGYFAEEGRAGAGWTGFDYDRETESGGKKVKFRDLPPLEREGARTLDEMWANIGYFLKAVIPAAEKAGVRLALHPNDPPAPVSRGSQQIMGTVEGWKKLIAIVDSPSNGITFDCGVTKEMGQDPVEVCRYFLSRDRINHCHFRNVKVARPYERYTEVFIDEGENNMFAVMRELIRGKYTRLIYPEHPRAIDYDRERPAFRPQYPGGGTYAAFAYNVGYARAMMQAALTVG
ncbi:MAG: mannonate dehydratase [Acidobacteriota bacterium]|nr:mannonate dehydratase [Acidobacteriota bacterium]